MCPVIASTTAWTAPAHTRAVTTNATVLSLSPTSSARAVHPASCTLPCDLYARMPSTRDVVIYCNSECSSSSSSCIPSSCAYNNGIWSRKDSSTLTKGVSQIDSAPGRPRLPSRVSQRNWPLGAPAREWAQGNFRVPTLSPAGCRAACTAGRGA